MSLASESITEIALMDVTGKLIRTIRPAGVLDAGTHHFAVSGNDLPEGMYFVRLIVNGKSETGKLFGVK